MEYTTLNRPSNTFSHLLTSDSTDSAQLSTVKFDTAQCGSSAQLEEALQDKVHAVNAEHITHAIVGVIQAARLQGQSLEDVMTELMADDALLDNNLRCLLGDIVSQAWEKLP